jgi:hypothetical protein
VLVAFLSVSDDVEWRIQTSSNTDTINISIVIASSIGGN